MTRRSELEEIRQTILTKVYKMSIELGLDPDNLDINLFAVYSPLFETQNTFNALCYKLQIIEKILGEIP